MNPQKVGAKAFIKNGIFGSVRYGNNLRITNLVGAMLAALAFCHQPHA
jgi:hypothetical protein